jgi:peptidoglycan-N-acetylglucosamine deacetylase
MNKQKEKHNFFSPFVKLGIASFVIASCLFFVNVKLCVLPIVIFFSVSLAAPFFPAFGYYLPIISRSKSGKKIIALTFDDGPDPILTPKILQLLEKYKTSATFFVIGSSAARYPQLINEIVRQGHTIGNHSYHHDSFLMFRTRSTLSMEIKSTQKELNSMGIQPLVFRPPIGITSPRLKRVLEEQGMICVNFSCRAWDGGNRNIQNLSQKILTKVRPGDIIMLHDTCPKDKELLPYWINELEIILQGIKEKKLEIVPLSEIIEKPVMLINSTV